MLKKIKKILMTETFCGPVYMSIVSIEKISGDNISVRDCFF